MSVILILVIFSVLLAGGFLAAFFWSVRNGQFDDPYGSSVRMLFDDEKPRQVEVDPPASGSSPELPTNP